MGQSDDWSFLFVSSELSSFMRKVFKEFMVFILLFVTRSLKMTHFSLKIIKLRSEWIIFPQAYHELGRVYLQR